jgi:hypothetical protein
VPPEAETPAAGPVPRDQPAPQGPTEELAEALAGDYDGRDLTEDELAEAEARAIESDPDVVDTDRRIAILEMGLA